MAQPGGAAAASPAPDVAAPAAAAPAAAPRRSPLIKDQLELRRVTDASGAERTEIAPIPDTLSFDKGFFLTFRAVQLLKAAAPPGALIVVGLAGPSGAGKTVFGEKLRELLPGSALLSMDMYNDGARVVDANYDDPRLCDYHTLLDNLAALRAGREAAAPVYDFKLSKRTAFRAVPVPPSRVVVVEGTFALSDMLRPHLDLRVAITGGVHRDLIKRVLRDVTRSGQAPEEIIAQISETVYPMYRCFIEPDLQTAHLMIQNTFNPFAGFATPTYVLKADATGLAPEAAAAALGPGCVTEAESGTVDIYLLPPHSDAATCATWLRMRSRDGRYLLVFEEFVTDGPFIISPNVRFEVNVRILGGLMALGYTVGAILKRSSIVLTDEQGLVTVKLDTVEGFDRPFVQVQGKLRAAVEEVARKLGLDEAACIPASYIQQVQQQRAGTAAAAAAAAGGTPASAADALSLFGVSAHGGGGERAAEGSVGAMPASPADPQQQQQQQQYASAASSAFAPTTPAPAPAPAPHSPRDAALASRVDALADAVGHLQAAQYHQYSAWGGGGGGGGAMSAAGGEQWPHNGNGGGLSLFSPGASPPGGAGADVARDVAALREAQRALAARVDALRAALSSPPPLPQQQQQWQWQWQQQALQQQPGSSWERLALAAAVGALLTAAALRVSA